MCHEMYHVDGDLRAIANRLTGLPMAKDSAQRMRSQRASRLLLNVACCEGLLDYVRTNTIGLATGEQVRICAKLRAIRERFAMEAIKTLDEMDSEVVPF